MANRDDIPRTTPAEIEHLIEQIRGANLDQGSKDKIERLLRTVLILVELLERRNTSIKKLREMIFGRRTEKHHGKKPEGKDQKSESGSAENQWTKTSGNPMEAQFSERLIEPNSSLGKALRYWLNHWDKLTVWLRVPGTPLDNNQSERALKQFILMRKNSLFFKTEHGAAIGDLLASLILTCRLNGINSWDYLTTIIRNKSDARRNPQKYLPWNYREEEGSETLAA
jgi:Transposase IS66 family